MNRRELLGAAAGLLVPLPEVPENPITFPPLKRDRGSSSCRITLNGHELESCMLSDGTVIAWHPFATLLVE